MDWNNKKEVMNYINLYGALAVLDPKSKNYEFGESFTTKEGFSFCLYALNEQGGYSVPLSKARISGNHFTHAEMCEIYQMAYRNTLRAGAVIIERIVKDCPFFKVASDIGSFGATLPLYNHDGLAELAEVLKEDLLVCSITKRELYVTPMSFANTSLLFPMLIKTIDPANQLTDKLYVYNRSNNTLTPWAE